MKTAWVALDGRKKSTANVDVKLATGWELLVWVFK
jgi:hypothetical protein